MRKFILVFLWIVLLAAIGFGYYVYQQNEAKEKGENSQKPSVIDSASNEKRFKPSSLYTIETEDFLASFDISAHTDSLFNAQLHILYIQDMYKKVALVEETWDVSGKRVEANRWDVTISSDNVTLLQTTVTLGEKDLTIEQLPNVGKHSLIMNASDEFDFDTHQTTLTSLYAEKINQTKANAFSAVPFNELSSVLTQKLEEYPIHDDGTLRMSGISRLYVHTDYLADLSSRIEKNFVTTQERIKEARTFIQKQSPKTDEHYEENVQKRFGSISSYVEQTDKLMNMYKETVSYYAFPRDDKETLYDWTDKETIAVNDKLLATYSQSTIKQYNQRHESLKKSFDNAYILYQEKTRK